MGIMGVEENLDDDFLLLESRLDSQLLEIHHGPSVVLWCEHAVGTA